MHRSWAGKALQLWFPVRCFQPWSVTQHPFLTLDPTPEDRQAGVGPENKEFPPPSGL